MPKLAKTPYQKRCDHVSASLEYWFTLRGITSREEKARIIGCKSLKTVTDRKTNPGDYTLSQLWRLKDSLKIPAEEFARFFSQLG